MKKILCAALCALLLLGAIPALGDEEHAYQAVVACENVAERLNLRAAPSTEAESLGQFYAGTPAYVEDDLAENGFARVRVGNLTGYMMRENLMRYNRNYDAPALFQTAYTRSRSIPLRAEAKNSARQVGLAQGMVYVLGDIGVEWRYVLTEDGGLYGFVRTAELRDRDMSIESAYLIPGDGGEWVTVYEDKEMKRETARYYSGTLVRVDGVSKNGGWAAVECCGVRTGEWEFDTVTGYVRLKDLRVFCQPWEVSTLARKGVARQDMILADSDVFVPAGASLTVAGETKDQYHVICGSALSGLNASALVEKSSVELTDEIADGGYPPRLGFALLPYETEEGWPLDIPMSDGSDREAERYTDLFLAEIIGEGEDWLQVRQPGEPSFFVQREGCQIIRSLFPQTKEMKNEETWIAGEEDAGLWMLTVEAGKAAELTTVRAGGQDYNDVIMADRPQNGAEHYAVYIAPGMEVNLTGEGVLSPAAENDLPVILPAHPQDTYVEKEIFTGSGRFFCDLQLPDQRNWFSYRARPMNGAEESWLAVTDLFDGLKGYSSYERIELAAGADEWEDYFYADEWFLDAAPGQFLELHNCILEICYGNG